MSLSHERRFRSAFGSLMLFASFYFTSRDDVRRGNEQGTRDIADCSDNTFFWLARILVASMREERKFVHCAMRSVPWCAVPLHEQQRNIPPLILAPPSFDRPTPKLSLPLLLSNVPFNSPIPIDTYVTF